MKKLSKTSILCTLILIVALSVNCKKKNKSPDTPSILNSSPNGKVGQIYSFSASATDPDDDSVAIRFD